MDLVWLGLLVCLFSVFGVRREHVQVGYDDKRSQCPSITLIEEIPFSVLASYLNL